jgi:hypothetical protein
MEAAHADLNARRPERLGQVHRPRKLVRLYPDHGDQAAAAVFQDPLDDRLRSNARVRLVQRGYPDSDVIAEDAALDAIGKEAV